MFFLTGDAMRRFLRAFKEILKKIIYRREKIVYKKTYYNDNNKNSVKIKLAAG